VQFRWSSAIQTTCDACRSVIVRHDVDLETIGEVSDLPPDSSPIRLGTQGQVDGRGFTVIGRIVYEYEDGGWNEWHLVYADGTSGWLSDAQLEYAVSSLVAPPQPLPSADKAVLGYGYTWDDRRLEVTSRTVARYKGVEGELPFEYWGKEEVLFADLRGHDATFGTLDYSDGAPLLFIGRFVSFDELHLRDLRTFEAIDRSQAMQGFNCSNCGAAVELRALSHTRSVACTSCGALLDPRDPNVHVLQEAASRTESPVLPLGTRGEWHGHPYDVIGYQRRSITVEGERYPWDEYLLFNPYQGFRYLTVYNGHWNDVTTVRELPTPGSSGSRPTMHLGADTFRHFQHAVAKTEYVLGEFPWRVTAGDAIEVDDYVSPPSILSSEGTGVERTWSLGRYTPAGAIWKAFSLPGTPERPVGVFANQPNPHIEKSAALWRAFRWLAALVLLLLAYRQFTSASEVVFSRQYTYEPGHADSSFVTPTFTLKAPGTLDLRIDTSLTNSWLGYDLALINMETGEAYNVGSEVSYYAGVEDGESWSEGSRSASKSFPTMPAGEYYLRVEPEGPPNGPRVPYTVRLRRDVPAIWPYLVALVLLAIRPLWVWLRKAGFELARDKEGDYGTTSSSGDDDADDDDD
jgi:DNA-directed RNA polymerase subunit RPC12/RpoP